MKAMALVLMALMGQAPGSAPFDASDWTWQSPVDTTGAPPGFVRAVLPPEVLDGSLSSLADLRLVDETNHLVPYVVHRERPTTDEHLKWVPVDLINRTYQPAEYSRVTLDFGKRVLKNRIQMTLSGANYRRRVVLEGLAASAEAPSALGAEGERWETILENAWLFDITRPDKEFKLDTVDFPPNDFRYLRLTVYNMPDDPQRVEVESVKAALFQKRPAKELTPAPLAAFATSYDDKTHQTVLDMDLGYRNLPVTTLSLSVADPYFYRAVELLGRNEVTEKITYTSETGWEEREQEVPWRPALAGVIFRIEAADGKVCERVSLENLVAPYWYLQFRIYDADNPPLTISGATALRTEVAVLFESKPGNAYTLMTGNPKAVAPQFDLPRAVENLAARQCPTVPLGPLAAIEHAPKLTPWTERHPSVLWIALIVAAGVMALLIVTSLRRIKPV